MIADIYWIELQQQGRLAILGRPRPGDWLEDEIQAWNQSGIDIVVSALTDEEINELGLLKEADICKVNNIDYLSFPIRDRSCPDIKSMANFIRPLADFLQTGKNIGVHCRGGIGRSTLICASIMITLNIHGQEAIEEISKARGCSVPDTEEQKQWIFQFE